MTGLVKLATAAFGASLTIGALAGGAVAATTVSGATCQQSGNQLVQNVGFTTGKGTFTSLTGNVASGNHLVASFTVPANCTVVVSLVSYQAPSATYDPGTASLQTVFASQDGVSFGAGTHSLAINIPACFFQVDFVRGVVIQHLGPKGSNNFYGVQGRLISAGNGGTTACGVIGGITQTPTPQSVLGITTTTTPQGNVAGIATPPAGVNLAIGSAALLAVLGLLLVLVGRARGKVV